MGSCMLTGAAATLCILVRQRTTTTRLYVASRRCCVSAADLTRARTGGLDSAGPSSPAVRLPEEDDLFGLGMTGFVPNEPASSAAGVPAAQPLDAAVRGMALSQPSPVLQREPREMQQRGDGSGHGIGTADSRRPSLAGLAAADLMASPVRRALHAQTCVHNCIA